MRSSDSKEISKKYQALWGQLNNETKEHCLRVAELSAELASLLGLDTNTAYRIGYLHDIGKIYIPSRILKKNAVLTKIERQIIDLHSYIGYMLLKDLDEPNLICLAVLYHHGFNKHLIVNIVDNPENSYAFLYFSLIYVADIFDARTHKRNYHNLSSVEEILNDFSTDWMCDPRVLDALMQHIRNAGTEK